MKHQIDKDWNMFEVLYLMERLAREFSVNASLTLYDDEYGTQERVSLGLSAGMYAAAYHIVREMDIQVTYPDGRSITYSHWDPGFIETQGGDAFDRAVSVRIQTYTVPDEWRMGRPALSFARTRQLQSLPVPEILRLFYRAALDCGASMSLTDEHLNGKLVQITASWMLNVYEQPIDIILRFKEGGWFMLHMANCTGYASSDRFFEAQKLLKYITHE